MRLSSAATVGMLLSLTLVLPSCGDEGTARAGGEATSAASTSTGSTAPKAPAPSGTGCPEPLRHLLGSMDVLRRRLAAGVDYDQYLYEVRALRAVYDDIPAERVRLACLLTVGAPAERALNRYLDAANTWGDCLATAGCSSESVEPKLQRRWALASDQLSAAQRGLREVAPN